MNQKNYLFALLLLVSCTIGCGSIDPLTQRESLGYVPARFYDFLDIIELNLALDSEFSLFVMAAVEPIAVGGGIYSSEKFGLDGRLAGQWHEDRIEVDLAAEGVIQFAKTPNWGNRYLYDANYCPHHNLLLDEDAFYTDLGFSSRLFDHERRFLDVVAEVHLFAFGIDISVSPLELLDFATGFFGLDVISDDDWVASYPKRDIPFFEDEEVEETVADTL